MAGGVLFGGFAATEFMFPRSCVLPAEATLDPILGAAMGAWYGPVFLDWLSRLFRRRALFDLAPELHSFCDTFLGAWAGYHLAYGVYIVTAWRYDLGVYEPYVGAVLLLVPIGTGILFYKSTKRWLARIGHDGAAAVLRPEQESP
jgi:hypothetical protein